LIFSLIAAKVFLVIYNTQATCQSLLGMNVKKRLFNNMFLRNMISDLFDRSAESHITTFIR
jgi:hypothetical protein